jgi:hypothetical protein
MTIPPMVSAAGEWVSVVITASEYNGAHKGQNEYFHRTTEWASHFQVLQNKQTSVNNNRIFIVNGTDNALNNV